MDKNDFKPRLITKLAIAGVFTVLTIASAISLSIVNRDVIAPNEGFITNALCKVDTGVKNNMGDKLAIEIEREGIVLAKNATNDGEDKPVLPLDSSVTKVNVFGYDAIQWVISNSGSGTAGTGTGQSVVGILEALDERGVTYDQNVISYYRSWADPRNRGTLSYSSNFSTIYRLTNPSLSKNSDYLTRYEAAKGDVDTAIVVIGRWGGEHLDPPHEQTDKYKASPSQDLTRGYLEITTEEEELLTRVGQDYKNVIVIVNSTNTMQMDFMERIPGLDACLLVGPTGILGARAIPQIMWGDYAPSGKTADTWPMNHRYNPAYWTSGYFSNNGDTSDGNGAIAGNYYTGVPSGANLANNNANSGHGHAVFADYIEGIYVGYKWYETADHEGYWDSDPYNGYENVVAYPFGFGLSYTTFDWQLLNARPNNNDKINANQDIELQVRVTNTGNVPAKDVVEVYLTADYYPGEIEKAYVKLVGFAKTNVIMPGTYEDVPITLKTRDFLQFDCYDANGNGHDGYELDRGDYNIKFMTSAHEMKEDMADNTIRYVVDNTIDVDEDPETGNEVKPLFTGNDAIDGVSMDGKSINEPIEYFTRENFRALPTAVMPTRAWNKGLETCDDSGKPTAYSTNMAREWDNAEIDVFDNDVNMDEPTFGADNGLAVLDERNQLTDLGKILAADYNAPEWEDLLDQLDWNEASTIVKGQSYHRPGLPSVGLKTNDTNSYNDAEGACQVGGTKSDGSRNTAYPDPCVQGQCWSERLSYSFGLSESRDMMATGNDYLYGPASNIHRSPYGGRHAEYHSEDGFLAGKCLSNVTKGLAHGGKSGFIKHFALNDTEYHRVGCFTWCTEQALREIYLRPFEEAVKNGEACALMSSFNRIGAIWTGGSQALMQGVLRNEWGFNGMTITDYTENGTLQDANQQFRAGGNFILASSNFSDPGQDNATNRYKNRLRESAKQVIYGSIRPQYVNYAYNNDSSNKAIVSFASKAPWVWWKPTLYGLEGLVIAGFAFGIFAALWPSNEEFRNELLARLFKKKKKDEPEAE